MLCHQCGSPVSQEDTKCPNCGASLSKKTTKRSSAVRGRNLAKFTTQMRAITEDDLALIAPTTILSGRFLVDDVLGKGPMGQVLNAKDQNTGEKVAIKVFDPKLFPTNKDLNAFKSSVKTTGKKKHDKLVSILGCGILAKKPWIAMDFVEGLSLAKVKQLRQTKNEHFTLEEITTLLNDIGPALSTLLSAHPHGGLTPSNIYVWSESYLISDQAMMSALPGGAWRLKKKNDAFLAPELQSKTTKLTEAQDVFALGAIISDLVFDAKTPPGDVDASLSALAEVCRKATKADPKARHNTVAQFIEAALDATSGKKAGSPPPPPMGLEELSSPPPPPIAPAGVEPVSKNKEATQVLADDELDIITESTEPVKSTPKKTPKRRTKRKDKRPLPKAEEVAATAISGAGESRPDSADDQEIATIEINRGAPELGDLLPTNDLQRGKIPPPRQPKLERESTKSTASPAKKKDEKTGIPIWAVGLIIVSLLAIGAVIVSNNKTKRVVEDNDPVVKKDDTKADVTTPKKDDPKTDVKPDDALAKKVEEGTSAAKTSFGSAALAALTASNEAAKAKQNETKTDTKSDPENKTDAKTDTKNTTLASNTKTNKPDKGAKANTTKTDKGSKATDAGSQVSGTSCPRGMTLVKSKKSGNVCIDRYEYPGAGRPKTNVSWFQAVKMCEGRGKRLCALGEWRRACGSKYPGTSKWDPNRCNTQDEDEVERDLTSVGKFKKCRSRSGAYDMTGNAHEWVAEKLIAGGGFDSGPNVAKCSYASRKSPSSKASYIGFRCCATPK